jgi:hypothetical protein
MGNDDLPYRPGAPLTGWPRQWAVAKLGWMWLTPTGPALVTQTIAESATPAAIDEFHDRLDELLAAGLMVRFPKLYMVHDWRSIREIPAGTREVWRTRAARKGKPFQKLTGTYLAVTTSPLLRMALQASSLAVQLISGQPPPRIVTDPTEVLSRLVIGAPPAGYLETWLARGH